MVQIGLNHDFYHLSYEKVIFKTALIFLQSVQCQHKSLSFVKDVLVLFLHIRYFWTKDGKAFDWILFNDRMTQRAGSGTLVIKSPREEDVGKLKVKILQKVSFIIMLLLPKMNTKLYTKLNPEVQWGLLTLQRLCGLALERIPCY